MIQKLVFKRGNLIGDDHPLPVVAEVEMSLACRFPSSITLLADEPGMRMIHSENHEHALSCISFKLAHLV